MKRSAGDRLMKCKPYAHVTTKSQHELICHYCFQRCEALKTCSQCKFSKYCKRACQKGDWLVHKIECKCLCKVSPLIPTESVRLFLRLLIRLKLDKEGHTFQDEPGICTFDDMESHINEVCKDSTRRSQFADICFTIRTMVKDLWELPPLSTLMHTFGKMVINSFTIQCPETLNAVGAGVYLSPSKLDHSCLPNCTVVFLGSELHLYTNEDLEDDSVEKLRISYVEQFALTQERQTQLQTQYYFTCTCTKCSDPTTDESMLVLRCQNDQSCTGKVAKSLNDTEYRPCSECDATSTDPDLVTKVERCYSDTENELKKLRDVKETGDLNHALELCDDLLTKQEPFLHTENIHYVRTYEEAFEISILLEHWQAAAMYGPKTLDGYLKHLSRDTPNLTVYLLKLAKTLIYVGDVPLQDVMVLLSQAKAQLQKRGPNHPLINPLNDLMARAIVGRKLPSPFSDGTDVVSHT